MQTEPPKKKSIHDILGDAEVPGQKKALRSIHDILDDTDGAPGKPSAPPTSSPSRVSGEGLPMPDAGAPGATMPSTGSDMPAGMPSTPSATAGSAPVSSAQDPDAFAFNSAAMLGEEPPMETPQQVALAVNAKRFADIARPARKQAPYVPVPQKGPEVAPEPPEQQYTPNYIQQKKEAGRWTAGDELRMRETETLQRISELKQRELDVAARVDQQGVVTPMDEQEIAAINNDKMLARLTHEEAIKEYAKSGEVLSKERMQEVSNAALKQAKRDISHGNYLTGDVLNEYIGRPVANAINSFGINALGGIARTLDAIGNAPAKIAGDEEYYSPFAEFADWATEGLDYVSKQEAEDTKRSMFDEDWNVNEDSLLPNFLRMGVYMGGLVAAGAAGGRNALGLASYLTTEEDYYREAIEAGLSPSQAQQFSMPAAALTAGLEGVNPQLYASGTIKGHLAKRAIAAIKNGADTKEALRDAAKFIGKEVVGENAQEFLQAGGDMFSRYVANQSIGREAMDASMSAQEIVETALMTTALSGFVAGGARAMERPLHQQAIEWAVKNPEQMQRFIAETVPQQEQDKVMMEFTRYSKVHKGLPEDMPGPTRRVVASAVAEKERIKEEQKSAVVDDVMATIAGNKYEEAIKAQDEIIADAQGLTLADVIKKRESEKLQQQYDNAKVKSEVTGKPMPEGMSRPEAEGAEKPTLATEKPKQDGKAAQPAADQTGADIRGDQVSESVQDQQLLQQETEDQAVAGDRTLDGINSQQLIPQPEAAPLPLEGDVTAAASVAENVSANIRKEPDDIRNEPTISTVPDKGTAIQQPPQAQADTDPQVRASGQPQESAADLGEGVAAEDVYVEPDLSRDVADDPAALASEYLNERALHTDASTLDDQIYSIAAGSIDEDSFKEFGDKNYINNEIKRTYLRKNGRPLDLIAQEISSTYGSNVTPQDVVDVMTRYPAGKSPISARGREIADRYYGITGKRMNALVANSILKGKNTKWTPEEQAIVDEAERQRVQLSEIEDSDVSEFDNMSDEDLDLFFGPSPFKKKPSDEKAQEQVQRRGAERTEGEVRGAESTGPAQGQAQREFEERSQELKSEVDRARKAYDKALADFNERGQSLFDENEGSTEPALFEGDTRGGDFDTFMAPHQRRLDAAQKALRDHFQDGDAFVEKRTKEIEAQTRVDGGAIEVGGRSRRRDANTLRIGVSPKTGEVRDLTRILKDLSKGTGRVIMFAKPSRRGMGGSYMPGSAAIKIKYAGDLDITAHEIGHALDDNFGLTLDAMKSLPALQEIKQLSIFGSSPPKGHKDPAKYEAQEGVAEYVRALIVNPDKAHSDFPALTALYDNLVSADAKAAIGKFSDDIRAFAAATGRDMVLANIEVDPTKSKSTVLKRIFDKGDPVSMGWQDVIAANLFDPLTAGKKAIEYAKDVRGIEDLPPSKDPYLLARLLKHMGGKVSEAIDTGMFTADLKVLKDENGNAKTLKWLMQPLDNTNAKTIQEEAKDVMAYMVAERTVELGKRFGRKNILTGIGAGLFSDVDVAQKALQEFELNPAKLERLKEAAKRYREMATHVLEYLRDKGRLSQEQFEQIKENNVQYVALQRVMETEPGEELQVFKGGGNLASVSKPIHSIYGSSRKINNPYLALIDSINKSIKEADRNEVLRAFVDLIRSERDMHEGEVKNLARVGVPGKPGDKNSITVFVDGKPETWILAPDVHDFMRGLDATDNRIVKLLGLPVRIMKWTITHSPIFAARNIVRDTQHRIILSNDNSGFKDLVGNKEHWREVARAGGLNSGYYMKDNVHYFGLMREAMLEMAENKKFILADPARMKNMWHHYKNALYQSETVNRVAEYRAAFREAKKAGRSDYDAMLKGAFEAADLIDFALMGHQMRWINQLIPFSNAMVQGLRSAYVHGKQNPRGLAARVALYSVLPSTIVWVLAHQNEDDEEEYEQFPAYVRDMFYLIKLPWIADQWIAIPKPFEMSLAGSAMERALSRANGNEKAFDGFAGSVLHSFVPELSGAAGPMKLPLELAANYDYFRENTLIPPHEEKLNLALRDTESASRASQAIQEAVGVDARKIDHLIRSQFTYYGKWTTKLSDIGREDKKNKFDLADLGFFKGTPAYNSAIVTEMIQNASQYGLTGSTEYKSFRKVSERYFKATEPEEKRRLAKEMRDRAETLNELFIKRGEQKVLKAERQ